MATAAMVCEINVEKDPKNCGTCGVACNVPQNGYAMCSRGGIYRMHCAQGLGLCHNHNNNVSSCLPIQNVVSNCGGCGKTCPSALNGDATCSAGACGLSCHLGFQDCHRNASTGCEVDTSNDLANCGKCGNTCASPDNSDATCVGGSCGFTCHAGYKNCDGNATNGCEADLTSDLANCGACNATCSGTCSNSTCTAPPPSCSLGFANCDGNATNGCETYLTSDTFNCGACNATCSPGMICSNSTGADITCAPGFTDCDGDWRNGCEKWTWGNPLNGNISISNVPPAQDGFFCNRTVTPTWSSVCIDIGDMQLSFIEDVCGYPCGQVCENPAYKAKTCVYHSNNSMKCGSTCENGYSDCDGFNYNGCETEGECGAD